MARRGFPALLALSLLVPGSADAILTIEGFYGAAWPPSADFEAAVGGVRRSTDLSEDTLQIAGGDILVNLGGFQLGAIVDTTFGDGPTQTAIGALAGFRLGDRLRFDLLGEAGGHRFGNVFQDQSLVTGSEEEEWLFYVGLRPGVAYRLGQGPSGLFLGVWGFVRWDVTDKDVPATVGSPPSVGNVELGGTTIGATVRLGFEI